MFNSIFIIDYISIFYILDIFSNIINTLFLISMISIPFALPLVFFSAKHKFVNIVKLIGTGAATGIGSKVASDIIDDAKKRLTGEGSKNAEPATTENKNKDNDNNNNKK